MRTEHRHANNFTKPQGCTDWWPNAATQLAEASFLEIEPHGEVYSKSGDDFYAGVNVADAAEWCIIANFADKPSWIVASFDIADLKATLTAALRFKKARPIFYRSMSATFELEGKTEREMIAFIKAHDAMFDEDEASLDLTRGGDEE